MSTKLGDIGLALRAKFGALMSDPDGFVGRTEQEAAQVAGEEVQAKAIELAPHRTGDLEASSVLSVEGNRAEIAFTVDYAAEAHELPETAVGPGTRAKPGNELGPAGPKFLERPIIAMYDRLPEVAAATLTKNLNEEVG